MILTGINWLRPWLYHNDIGYDPRYKVEVGCYVCEQHRLYRDSQKSRRFVFKHLKCGFYERANGELATLHIPGTWNGSGSYHQEVASDRGRRYQEPSENLF